MDEIFIGSNLSLKIKDGEIRSSVDIAYFNGEILVRKRLLKSPGKRITEFEFLKRLKGCEGIIQMKYHRESDKYFDIYMEYCESDIFSFIRKAKKEDRNDIAMEFFGMILKSLSICHRKGITHFDIKPQNILIHRDGHIRLADFGLSFKGFSRRVSGTLHYISPETLNSNLKSSPKADIWSLGITLYWLCSGKYPFGNNNRDAVKVTEEIILGDYEISERICDRAKIFLLGMLVVDPAKRFSSQELLKMYDEWNK